MGSVDMKVDKNVFITGASGFVGSELTKKIVDSGVHPVILVRDDVPRSSIKEVRSNMKAIVRGSITDYNTIERCLNEYEIEVIYHLAAQTIVGCANRSPLSTFESNIKGTWNMLEAARRSETVECVVIASSDKAYGDQKELPYKEDYSLLGRHPYDVSKACADLLAQAYNNTYGLPVTIARCANIYGGGDYNYSRIVPGTIQSLIKRERPIIRSDGTPVRDYMYVADVVTAYMTLGEQIRRTKGEAFNFGADSKITVIELVNKIVELFGSDLKPKVLGAGKLKGEIQDQYLSIDKASNELGWNPKYSLEEGLIETIAWYRKHLE